MCSCQGTLASGLSLACYVYIIQHCTRDVNRSLVSFIVWACTGVRGRAWACMGVRWRAWACMGVHGRAWAGVGVRWRAWACMDVYCILKIVLMWWACTSHLNKQTKNG